MYHPDHPDNATVLGAELEPADGAPQWIEIVWPLLSHVDGPVLEAARSAGSIGVERFRALSAELPGYDVESRLGEIEVPTLVIHGEHDASMPVNQGRIIAQGIPDAELVVIEECGHFPFCEQPAAFDHAVRTFLHRTVADSEGRSS